MNNQFGLFEILGSHVIDSRYTVERFRQEHLGGVARVHESAFAGHFLTSLGQEFLEHFYGGFLNSPLGCILVCIDDQTSEVVGFVAGALDRDRFYRGIIKSHAIPLTLSVLKRVLREPALVVALWERLVRLIRMVLGASRATRDLPNLPAASLMSIGVAPSYRRKGLASWLEKAFLEELAAKGIHSVKLGVSESNRAACEFYKQRGWEIARSTVDKDGKANLLLVKRAFGSVSPLDESKQTGDIDRQQNSTLREMGCASSFFLSRHPLLARRRSKR